MKKVIIKSGFSSHQRFMLILFFIFSFILGTLELIAIALSETLELYAGDYILLFLFILSLGILVLLISKEGIIIYKNKLFNSQFIFGKPYLKSEVDLNNMHDISILNYNMSQKLVFISSANPNFSEKIRVSKIFLLNENHSHKRLVLSTKKIEHAELIVNEIKNAFSLNYNNYSPPTRRRRR